MSTEKPTTPFMEGFAAFGHKDIHGSPYPKGSRERTKWVNGWQFADAKARKAADAAQLAAIEARPLEQWMQEATQ